MGRERQKKKNRSSVHKVKAKRVGRTKAGKKKVDFLGNAIIAENWDRKLTVSQNYKQLGLSSRLNSAAGGVEQKTGRERQPAAYADDSLAISQLKGAGNLLTEEVQVERDPKTGHILRILRPLGEELEDPRLINPLNDPLNDLSDEEKQQPKRSQHTGVVDELEAQAAEEAERLVRTKRPRQQSQREEEWIQRLVEKHGDNIMAMVRDRKLNPMQQTHADISRRIRKWRTAKSAT